MSSGAVKFGPFSFRSFISQRASAPSRQAVGAHQLFCPGRRFIFQHFMISCHCSGVNAAVSVTPFWFSIRVSWSGVKIDGMKNANSPRRSTSYTRSSVARLSSSVSPGLPTISVIAGYQ